MPSRNLSIKRFQLRILQSVWVLNYSSLLPGDVCTLRKTVSGHVAMHKKQDID